MRELEVVYDSGVFVLKESYVVGEESHLEVKVRGPGNAETSWKWGGDH